MDNDNDLEVGLILGAILGVVLGIILNNMFGGMHDQGYRQGLSDQQLYAVCMQDNRNSIEICEYQVSKNK